MTTTEIKWPTENAGEAFADVWQAARGEPPFAGWHVTLKPSNDGAVERFVTPAALANNINQMVTELLDRDPSDEFVILVKWTRSDKQPLYI